MKRKDTLVSIIVPVFNASNWISTTIQSVKSQTYSDWELILVDDCSSDNSYELLLCAAKTDIRIRVFKNIVNSKAFETRNVGLRSAEGRFIAFLDADDIWDSEKLERQIRFMIDIQAPISYTAFRRFLHFPNCDSKIIYVKERVSLQQLLTNTIIVTSSVIIDTYHISDFEMENVYYDDFVLWVRLLSKFKYAFGLNEPLLYYRVSNNSLSRNKLKSAREVYKIFSNYLDMSFIKANIYFILWVKNALVRYIFKY
jgi:teichuronic acid biosynthesis glycosyltransferase TuaG